MIPYSNKNNLFLSEKVLAAAAEGKFGIWVIKTIDEGISLLSGLDEKTYSEKISRKLHEFYERVNEVRVKNIG